MRIGSPSRLQALALALLHTISPALPSAGWVWDPKVTVPSGITGRSLARPSAVVGEHALVGLDGGHDLAPARVHLVGRDHVALEKARFDALLVLLVAHQRERVLLFAADVLFLRHVLRGLDHRALRPRVALERVHYPVFRRAGAPRTHRVGVVDVRTVGGLVGAHHQSGLRHAELDALGRELEARRRGRTRLGHHRPRDTGCPDQTGQPGRAVEDVLGRNRPAEHEIVELGRLDFAGGQRLVGHVGGEVHGVQARQAALPLAKRRRPVAASGEIGVLEAHDP